MLLINNLFICHFTSKPEGNGNAKNSSLFLPLSFDFPGQMEASLLLHVGGNKKKKRLSDVSDIILKALLLL